jgi:glyoxylase-like metal-dependent hydrolase (beta-lactamase superfamily II)
LVVERVSEGLGVITLEVPQPYESVNVYIMGHEGHVCMVDVGPATQSCLAQVEHGLAELGFKLGQLESIVLTHGHVDHAGLAGTLQRLTGCHVYVHPRDLDWLVDPADKTRESYRRVVEEVGDPQARSLLEKAFESHVSRLRQHYSRVDPEPLRLDAAVNGLLPIEAPGHTLGSVVYSALGGRVGLCGDTVLGSLTLVISDLASYFRTLSDIGRKGFQALWPGHGPPLQPAAKWVGALIQKYSGRVNTVRAMLGSPKTLYEVARALYADTVDWGSTNALKGNPALAVLQTKTYLDYLVSQGQVEQTRSGGVPQYVLRPSGI